MTQPSRPADTPHAPSELAPNITTGQFRRGVVSVGGGSVVSVAVLFAEAVVVARALPVEDMGVYALFQATLGLLTIAVDLGCRTTAAQFLAGESDSRRRASLAGSMLLLRLIVVGVVALPLWLGAPAVAAALGIPGLAGLLPYLPVVLLLTSLDELLTGMLQGFHRYRPIALAQVVRSLLRLAVSGLVLLVLGMGLQALVVSWMVSYGTSAMLQFLALPVARSLRLDRAQLMQALRFGLPLQATRYLWFAMQRIDIFLLTVLTGPIGVAFYEVGNRLPVGLQRLIESYFAVYHPSLSSRFARGDQAGASRLMLQSLRLVGAATLFAAWGALLIGEEALVLLFDEKYAAAAPALIVLLLVLSLSSTINLLGYALTASGRPTYSFVVNLVRSAVSVGAALVLIPAIGFIGAAYAALLAQLASAPLAWRFLRAARLPGHGRLLMRHFALAGAVLAAFWWLPPLALWVRLALLVVFPLAAFGLSLVSMDDFTLVVPERLLRRPGRRAALAGNPGGTKG